MAEVRVISADEAMRLFRERHRSHPAILSGLDEVGKNPFGAQLVLRARTSQDYPFLLQAIQNPQYVAFVQSQTYNDHQTAIARVREVGDRARLVGAALVALFSLFGLLAAFNAIRVAIYTQREEITIMRLVGASAGYIRGPFMLEGIWLACVSVFLSATAIWVILRQVEPMLRPLFDGSDRTLPLLQHFWQLVGLEGGGLIVLVILASWAAVGRYIHR